MYETHDLSLDLGGDCVVKVVLVYAVSAQGAQELPKEVSNLTNQSDQTEEQQEELCTLLLKWFAQHDEDFGQTDLVKHKIHTGDAALIREGYSPFPPFDLQRNEDPILRYAGEGNYQGKLALGLHQ